MLTEEENRTLTQVGPGTPMGELLRRYWHPIAAVQELEDQPTKRIPLLGERLVLYKDLSGNYGLISAFCGHRLTDLSFGIVEQYGLRCFMHGWLYNEDGRCLEQPLETEPFLDEIKLSAYQIAIKGGMIWAYLGPEPAPLVPDWEPFSWEDGIVQIVFAPLPCNWLQCQENSIDPIDIELFHNGLQQTLNGAPTPPPPSLQVGFDEFEHGFVYRRARKEEADTDAGWSIGRTCIWPNALFSGDTRSCHFEWRVPMDDMNTMSVAWFIDRVAPGSRLPSEQRFFHWYAPVKDEKNEVIDSHLINRSFVIWLHQEPIVDRTKEHLVESDQGVTLLRSKYFSQIALIADGGEPKSTIRDPDKNARVALPFTVPGPVEPDAPATAAPAEAEFPYLAGQPPEVEAVYKKVVATWNRRRRAPRTPRES
jgi:5,5'-dehydrodivanillate O-demethylase